MRRRHGQQRSARAAATAVEQREDGAVEARAKPRAQTRRADHPRHWNSGEMLHYSIKTIIKYSGIYINNISAVEEIQAILGTNLAAMVYVGNLHLHPLPLITYLLL
jgi:hypothetical protein